MDPDDAVLLTDVVPTGYQASEMSGIQKGDTVVIFGAGPIGIMATRCAWLFGAGQVIVYDHLDYRLEFVKQFAPAEVYNYKEVDDVVVFMKKTTDGRGADVAMDAVGGDARGNALQWLLGTKLKLFAGSAIPLHWAINSVKKGGVVSIVGAYGPTGNVVPIGNVVNKGITIRANQASVKRLLPRLIEHVEAGHINPKAMITHKVPLQDVADAYHIFATRAERRMRITAMDVRMKTNSPDLVDTSTIPPAGASTRIPITILPTRCATRARTVALARHGNVQHCRTPMWRSCSRSSTSASQL